MPKPPYSHVYHTAAYAAAGLGLVGFLVYAFANYTLFPAADPHYRPGRQWWLTDMMDSKTYKAFEVPMPVLPEGAVSRNRYFENADRMTPEGAALANPYPVDDATLASGEWGFVTYCAPCHGPDAKGNGPVTWNKPSEGMHRFQLPATALAGDAGALKLRQDGYVYLTIRNGGALMPDYAWAMSDREMWAVVAYLRTLPGSQYQDPTPASVQ